MANKIRGVGEGEEGRKREGKKEGERNRQESPGIDLIPAIAASEDDAAGYYPATVIAGWSSGKFENAGTRSSERAYALLVRGIRYRSFDKHRRWYFPSSWMSRVKKGGKREKKVEIDDGEEKKKKEKQALQAGSIGGYMISPLLSDA